MTVLFLGFGGGKGAAVVFARATRAGQVG